MNERFMKALDESIEYVRATSRPGPELSLIEVQMWLGCWRDLIPSAAVEKLQDILLHAKPSGPPQRHN